MVYILLAVWMGCLFMLIRTFVVSYNHTKIVNAISAYNRDNHYVGLGMFDLVEAPEQTLLRVWDWGYKRILPKREFELVKPYIR